MQAPVVTRIVSPVESDGIRDMSIRFFSKIPNHWLNGLEIKYLDGPDPNERLEFLRVFEMIVPFDSMESGNDQNGQPLYLCVGIVNERLITGNYKAPWSGCSVAANGVPNLAGDFRLVKDRPNFSWMPKGIGEPLLLARQRSGEGVYGCRGNVNGIRSGSYNPERNTCVVSSLTGVQEVSEFDVLVKD